MENSLVLLFVLCLVNPVSGGATFSIKVLNFFNPDYLNFYGDCCDGVKIAGSCALQCFYTFKICFSCNHCTSKKSLITAEGNMNFSSEVITTSFEIWRPITMNISIYDEDTQSSDLIDEFFLNFNYSPVNKEEVRNSYWIQRALYGTRKQKPARLMIEMLPMCEKNFFRENCSIKCVAQNECSGHYTCSQTGEKICNDGWSGENCQQPAVASIRCGINETCNNGGTCARLRNVFYCCCPHKYEGRQCENLKTCKIIPCENGGNCSSSGACICQAGFSGPFCERKVTTIDIITTKRSSHATITESQQCPKNYYGPQCDVFCQPQNNCIYGSYKCNKKGERECRAGWLPPLCDLPKINCIENKCRNNGSCVAGKCCCPYNFNGVLCENEIIHCANKPCENGGTCKDQIGSSRCLCRGGFTGIRCELSIKDLSTTQSSSISSNIMKTVIEDIITNNSINIMTTSWITSTCPPHRYGDLCNVVCIAKDNSLAGHWMCDSEGRKRCKTGWRGPMCKIRANTDIPCSTDPYIYCRHGECVNRSCSCYNGYEGRYCQREILECLLDPCQNGGICVDGVGNFTCTCKSGFIGSTCDTRLIENTTMPIPYSPQTSITEIVTNKTVHGTREHLESLLKSTVSIPIVNDTSILEPFTFNTRLNEVYVSTNVEQDVTTGTKQQNGVTTTVTSTVKKPIIRQSTVSEIFNPVVTFTTSQVSTAMSHFPITDQLSSSVSSTLKSSDVISTTQARTELEVVTFKTTEGQEYVVTSSPKLKHGSTSVSTLQSNSLKASKDDFLSKTFTPDATIKTPKQNLISTNVSDFVTNKQHQVYVSGETRTPRTTQRNTPEPLTNFVTNTHSTFTRNVTPVGSTPIRKLKENVVTSTIETSTRYLKRVSFASPSLSSMSQSDNIIVTNIDTSSTVTKITSKNNMSSTFIPTITTKSTRSEYSTNFVSERVTQQTATANGVTKKVPIETTESLQNVHTNFTIFLHSWIPKAKGIIRKGTRLAWNKQNINNSSKINFHVKTRAIFLCLTRNGQKVTEFIFSVTHDGSPLLKPKAPTVGILTEFLKKMECAFEVYRGLVRPWRYEYHYTLFVEGREELPWSVNYTDILTKAWLKTYSEFSKYIFEIAIVLTERYLLPNGLDGTKFTYFVFSHYFLVDPKTYPAPSLSWELPVLSASQTCSVLRYKDANSIFITKTIIDEDYSQLEIVLKKSLTETFKELNESSGLQIQILKKEKFITLDMNTVWKVIFKVLNSTSIVPFPQNKLNDFWFDHVDNNLKRTKPFKTRENRVFRNDTAIDSFYTYNVTFNGVIPYKMCDTLELELLKFWRRKDKLNAQGNFSVRILQIIPYSGDYGSESTMFVYVIYNEAKLLNPRHVLSPPTDALDACLEQKSFFGIYRGNISRLIPNDFLYSFTLNFVLTAFGEDGFQLRTILANVTSLLISDHVSSNFNQIQIFFAKPKLVVTTNNSIVSNVRYFILNNSIPLNPITIEGPRTKLLRSAGIDVHEKPVRALMKLEVTKPYVNLRQLQQIKSALVTAWIPKGSTNVQIYTTSKEQLINNTGHIHTRLWYFISLRAPLVIPDLSFISDYLDFDANRRLYRINILNAYKRVETNEVIVLSLKNAWVAANKGITPNVLHPIIHSWNNNYHMVTWGLVTQVFYSLTVQGIESSLTALSEPSSEDYELALRKDAKIGLCNCTALRGHFVYLVGSLTSSSWGQIENVIALAWRNANLDFSGNVTAYIRTVEDRFESENKKVSKVTYIIAPSFGGVLIPDEELEPVTETILLQTFAKYLPTIKILTNKANKLKYFVIWPIIIVCIVVGSIIIMLSLVLILYAYRKRRSRSREENLITDPKLLKSYNREHFVSEPESPNNFKNTFMLEDSFESSTRYSSRYGKQISGYYDINSTNSTDSNNFEINSSKSSIKRKHAVKLLPVKDNHSTNIHLKGAYAKEEEIKQFTMVNQNTEIKANETNDILFGSMPETHFIKLADTAGTQSAMDNVIAKEVASKNGTNKKMKQRNRKSMDKHVTINLDNINCIESCDSSKKNNKESFPVRISPEIASSKNDQVVLENKFSPNEISVSLKKNDETKSSEGISFADSNLNENEVTFENKSSVLDTHLERELKQLKTNQEIERVETFVPDKESELLKRKKISVEIFTNFNNNVADEGKSFKEFSLANKLDGLNGKRKETNGIKIPTRESFVDKNISSTTSNTFYKERNESLENESINNSSESFHSKGNNLTTKMEEDFSISKTSATNYNGNNDADRDKKYNQTFVTIIPVGQSKSRTCPK